MNILFVKLSAIGDVIHTLPALNAVRAKFPAARITWLVEEAAADLLVGHSALDRVIVSPRKRWLKQFKQGRIQKTVREIGAFIRNLRDTHYDVILDFQALLKSGVLIGLARGDRKIGFGRGMQHMEHSYLFLNERMKPVDMEIHALVRNLLMLAPLGIFTKEVDYRLPVGREQLTVARKLVEDGVTSGKGPMIAINCVAKWPTKLWPEKRFAVLADRLIRQLDARIVFTGAPEDHGVVENIVRQMDGDALNLAGKTSLKTLAAVYRCADLLISTDTGPMHLGAAAGVPVVALFGPTAPWRTGPYGDRSRVVRSGMHCSPCYKRHCETIACMSAISVEHVLTAVKEALDA